MAKVSPVGRVSYPFVFTPNVYKDKATFQLTLLFDKNKSEELAEMKAEAARVAKEKWGDKIPKDFTSPFYDGDEKADESPEFAGQTFIRFKRAEKRGRPEVVDARKQPISEDSGVFYAGCYARVSYSCYAWEEGKKGGVSFGLGNVQKVREGEPLDGRTKADNDFDVLEEVGTEADLF